MREDVYVARGEKTRVRPFYRSDVDQWQAWPDHPDPLYATHNPKRMPGSVRDAWYRDLIDRQDQQPYVVEDLDGRMIGRIFLRHVHSAQGVAVLGIDLRPDIVGRGYGSDALQAFLRHYFFELGFSRILLTVALYNERARRSYQRCGFESVGRHWGDHDVSVRPLLEQPRYGEVRRYFRRFKRGLQTQYHDMLLTAERFKALTTVDQQPRH